MQLTGTQFTRTAAVFGNDITTSRTSRPRSAPGRHPGRRLRLPAAASRARHPHPGRRARRPGGDEPGGPQDQPRGPAGRAACSSSTATPSRSSNLQQGRLRREPARRRLAEAVHASSRCRSRRSTRDALDGLDMTSKQKDRCKNFFALGLMFWLYEREPWSRRSRWIDEKFSAPAGRRRGEHAGAEGRLQLRRDDRDRSTRTTASPKAHARARASTGRSPATRRRRSGFLAAAQARRRARCSMAATRSRRPPTSCTSSPSYKNFGVRTFQAEDEIAAIGAAIGASFGGALA